MCCGATTYGVRRGHRRDGGADRRAGGAGVARRIGVRGFAFGARCRSRPIWPDPRRRRSQCKPSCWRDSPPILRLDEDLLYLDRYWLEEQQVCDDRLGDDGGEPQGRLLVHWPRLFRSPGTRSSGQPPNCAVPGVDGVDGGPGHRQDDDGGEAAGTVGRAGRRWRVSARLRIALAAPTGKAAARLQEAVQPRSPGSTRPIGRR